MSFKSFQRNLTKSDKIISIAASILGTLASLSFIEIIVSNANGKSNIYIQPIVVAINAAFWSLHAIIKKDWFLLIPNLIAIVLALIAASLAFI
jgi:hypothetical protein